MATKTIALNLKIDTRTGQASIKKVSKDIKVLGTEGEKSAKKMSVSWKAAAAAVTAFSAAVVAATKGFIDAYAEQEQAEKRLATVIEATGHAAGFTAEELYDMAAEMQKVTTYGDEVTISAMAIIATFKNIKGDAFERTATAAMDLSTVLGTDLKSSVIMIAKALNDPIANLGALGRAGVQFTDIQKDMIKELASSGKHMEAMGIILDELESQQGGAARAAREGTGIWKALGNAIGDVSEVIGRHLHEALAPVVEKTIEWIEKNNELIGIKVKEWIEDVKDEAKLLVSILGFSVKYSKELMFVLSALIGISLVKWLISSVIWLKATVIWLGTTATATAVAMTNFTKLKMSLWSTIAALKQYAFATVVTGQATSIWTGIILGAYTASASFGYILGTLINRNNEVKRAAEHSWNGIFFVIKYAMLKSELVFLQTIDKIKVGWKELKDWFIQTFPEMAQFMGMEQGVVSYNLKITILKDEIKELKKEYQLLEDAINRAFNAGAKPEVKSFKVKMPKAGEDGEGDDTGESGFQESYRRFTSTDMENRIAAINREADSLKKMTDDKVAQIGIDRAAYLKIHAIKEEGHQQVLTYISSESDNKRRAIQQETQDLLKFTDSWEEQQAIIAAGQVRLDAVNAGIDAKKLADQKTFYDEYNELTMSQFELEREQLAEHIELQREMWEEAGITKNEIEALVSEKTLDIAKREQMAKLAIYSSVAGQIASTFSMIAQAGGKHSKAAFLMYKAFAIAQAIISTHMAIVKTLAEPALPYPSNVAMAKVIGAMGIAKVAMIAAQKPPSFDQGGVSNAKGIYQTGNIAEAHIPIPSGGKIPVEISDKEGESTLQEINIVNVFNPDMLDEFLASSSGQDAIVNVIDNRAQAVKRILR